MNKPTTYTLSSIQQNPASVTSAIKFDSEEALTFRPLTTKDIKELTTFLENLSPRTRNFYTLDSFDSTAAQEFCNALNKYDKLRFVLTTADKRIVGLFEFSFDIPDKYIKRFLKSNIHLSSKTDCRIGLCLADNYQGKGVSSLILNKLMDIAKEFNQTRVVLWGGVFMDNDNAKRFYKKNGFEECGKFTDKSERQALDMIKYL